MTPSTPLKKMLFLCLIAVLAAVLCGESPSLSMEALYKGASGSRFNPAFPSALFRPPRPEVVHPDTLAVESFLPQLATVPTRDEAALNDFNENRLQSVLLNNDIFAIYGKPDGRNMGLLGQVPIQNLEQVMAAHIEEWDRANGERGIIPAIYMIYGTVWPEGEIGILRNSLVLQYIEYAAERGWLVFLDHQIGRYSVEQAMQRLLPYLRYPHVHLALDPEWRTTRPMQEIGSITGAELNRAQQMLQDYLVENNLPGRRMLVFHQFQARMIQNRSEVRSDYELVKLIHCADGFGSPALKRHSYAFNAQATNIPLKSFKLFTKPTVAGAGWDEPMMSPEEVFSLNPRPYLIMLQ